MANSSDNPFAPKPSLQDLIDRATPTLERQSVSALVRALGSPQTDRSDNSLGSWLNTLASPPSPRNSVPFGLLGGYRLPIAPPAPTQPAPTVRLPIAPPPPARRLPVAPRETVAPTKRKAFFSFHFDDLMRVNNVRKSWQIEHRDRVFMRNFYDRSLWESKKLESDEALKALIRQGMTHASAVCVLVGSGTYARRWVRYEIARSVIERKGLLAVHVNGLNHIARRCPDPLGPNPLSFMGIYQANDGRFLLAEKRFIPSPRGECIWQWQRYRDYSQAVQLPRYFAASPDIDRVVPLSAYVDEYDYVAQVGHKQIGQWIDRAAIRAGR